MVSEIRECHELHVYEIEIIEDHNKYGLYSHKPANQNILDNFYVIWYDTSSFANDSFDASDGGFHVGKWGG